MLLLLFFFFFVVVVVVILLSSSSSSTESLLCVVPQEEYDAYVTLKRLFGSGICNHMILVFVGVDCFGNTVEGGFA